ncbi:amidase [Xylariaceae sp. FL1272]|nr:amidase [Xylariaceae sp. FL1272]
MTMSSIALEELTIEEVHNSFTRGTYTAQTLTEAYQKRIQHLDRDEDGPRLNATLAWNPEALNDAKKLDDAFKAEGKFVGPLHGIPIVIKDTVQMKGLVTTFGSAIAKKFVSAEDSSVVKRLRDAGVVILAKTSMPDLGTDYFSTSTLNGRVRNPYALDRDTGASSSGTAAAIAANMAVVGLGGDSGGSIRIPASMCNLVGVRPTVGLISASGILSGIFGQATLGPITRTVRDAAIMMDAMIDFDSVVHKSIVQSQVSLPVGGSFTAQLGSEKIPSLRLGVIKAFFGDDDDVEQHAVNDVINTALEALQSAGCELVDIDIPDLNNQLQSANVMLTRAKYDFNTFLIPTLGTTINEIVEKGQFPKENVMLPYVAAQGSMSPYDSLEYGKQVDQREKLQLIIASEMRRANVSALVFPTNKLPPPKYSDIDQAMRAYFPTNTGLASILRFPAVTVPAGFTATSDLPVGLEIVGLPMWDQHLLNVAYVVEQLVKGRRAPRL